MGDRKWLLQNEGQHIFSDASVNALERKCLLT